MLGELLPDVNATSRFLRPDSDPLNLVTEITGLVVCGIKTAHHSPNGPLFGTAVCFPELTEPECWVPTFRFAELNCNVVKSCYFPLQPSQFIRNKVWFLMKYSSHRIRKYLQNKYLTTSKFRDDFILVAVLVHITGFTEVACPGDN